LQPALEAVAGAPACGQALLPQLGLTAIQEVRVLAAESVTAPRAAPLNRFAISTSCFAGAAAAPGAADWVPLTGDEKAYYDTLFHVADTNNSGLIAGQAAVQFFTRSNLEISVLKQVRVSLQFCDLRF
jgi:hypothetical protein